MFMALLFGFGSAAQIALSRLARASARQKLSQYLAVVLASGLLVAVAIVPLARFNIEFLINWLATTSGVGFAARDYLQVLVFAIPDQFCLFCVNEWAQRTETCGRRVASVSQLKYLSIFV